MAWRNGMALALLVGGCVGVTAGPLNAQDTAAANESIANVIARLKPAFTPVSAEQVAGAKKNLQQRLADLDALLRRSTAANRNEWRTYLKWDALEAQLKADKPDLSELQAVQSRYTSADAGLEWDPIVQARQALKSYIHLATLHADAKAADYFQSALDELSKRGESYAKTHQLEDAVAIGRAAGWLERSQQAPELVAAVGQRFAGNNLQLRISHRLAAAGVEEAVDDTMEVHENILGTNLVGTAHTQGKVGLAFHPNADRASLEILLKGETKSDNVGYHGPVTVYTRGVTQVAASKRIHLDAKGISADAATAKCATETVIDDICARMKLLEKMAWKQADKSKGKAESIGNRRAEQRVSSRVDEQASEMLDKASNTYADKIRGPLVRRDAFPRRLAVSTTADQIQVNMLQLGANQVAAATAAPEVPGEKDLSLQLHESFAGNLSELTLGGVTVTDEKVASLVEETTGNVPEELQLGPEKDPWSITFATEQPVSTLFSAEGVTISIRGRRFTRGDQEIKNPIKISATYRIEKTDSGSKFTRQGDVDIEFIGQKGGLSVQQVAFKTFMRRKFEALMKAEFVSEGIKLPGRWEKAGKLVAQHMQAADGWLALGWKLQPNPAPAAAGTESPGKFQVVDAP